MHQQRRSASAGFTLIEVMVVIAMLGLMMGFAVRGIRSLNRTDIKSASARMAGAMRYMFDRASTTGKVHRLVIDFEQGKYWAEVSDDRYFLPRDKETSDSRAAEWERIQKEAEARQRGEVVDDKAKPKGSGLGYGFGANNNSYDIEKYLPKPFERKQARFKAFKETTIKPVTLKKAKLYSLYTPRLSEPMGEGQGYVYFFPLGFAEAAIVHLTDEKQEVTYSLVVHPLTGRVRIYNRYIDPPLEAQYDDAGEVMDR